MSTESLEQVLGDFLSAFENLEWERFRHTFADDASVYFPFDAQPKLATGREQFEPIFAAFFDQVRARGSGPPYMRLVPEDRHITLFEDHALVIFRLSLPDAIGRRTVVLRRDRSDWRIIHLHASNISVAAPAALPK